MINPQTYRSFRTKSDLSFLFECSETNLFDAVVALPESYLAKDRDVLLCELLPRHLIQMPLIGWETGALKCEELPTSTTTWRVSATLEIRDPHYITSFVHWSGLDNGSGDYEPNQELGALMLSEDIEATSSCDALHRFDGTLCRYAKELTFAAREVSRYNSAVPYLLSVWIEHRLNELPMLRSARRISSEH